MGRPDDVVGRPGLGGPGQVTDLPEGKPEPPGPADQGQPPPVCHGVLTEARPPAFGQRQQSLPLIEAHSFDACSPGGEFPDRQPGHVPQASCRTPVRSQQDRTRHLTAGTPPSRLAARGPGGLNDPGSRGRRGLTVARTAGLPAEVRQPARHGPAPSRCPVIEAGPSALCRRSAAAGPGGPACRHGELLPGHGGHAPGHVTGENQAGGRPGPAAGLSQMASARTHVRNEPHFTFLSYVCSNSGHGSGHAYCWGAVSRSPGRRNGDAGHIRVPRRWGGGLPDGIAWSSPRSIRPDRRPPAAAPARQSHELRPRSGKPRNPMIGRPRSLPRWAAAPILAGPLTPGRRAGHHRQLPAHPAKASI